MEENEVREPTVSVSLSMKINLGNYESADAFLSVSGLKVGATEAEVNELLDAGKLAYDLLRERMKVKVQQIRADAQHPSQTGWR